MTTTKPKMNPTTQEIKTLKINKHLEDPLLFCPYCRTQTRHRAFSLAGGSTPICEDCHKLSYKNRVSKALNLINKVVEE